MAIQNRRGAYGDFDPSKMVPGEFAVVQSNDPNATDGKSVYLAFAAGDVKRLATHDDMVAEITDITEDIIEEVSTEIEAAIHDDMETASAAAETATQKATDASDSAEEAAQTVATIIDNTLSQSGKAADAQKTGLITAPQYSTSATYNVGDYVIYNGSLYRCTTKISTAESWTSGHWTAAKVGSELSDLKSAIDVIRYNDICVIGNLEEAGSAVVYPDYIRKSVITSTGEIGGDSSKRVTNKTLIYIPDGVTYETTANPAIYNPKPFCFDENGTFLGIAPQNNTIIDGTRYLRFLVARLDNGELTVDDVKSYLVITFYKDTVSKKISEQVNPIKNIVEQIAEEDNTNLIYGVEWTQDTGEISYNGKTIRVTAKSDGAYKSVYGPIDVSESNFVTVSWKSKTPANSAIRYGFITDGVNAWQGYLTQSPATIDVSGQSTIRIGLYVSTGEVETGDYAEYTELQIEYGNKATEFVQEYTAIDVLARQEISDLNAEIPTVDENLRNLADTDLWEGGSISNTTGKNTVQSKSVRLKDYLKVDNTKKFYFQAYYVLPDSRTDYTTTDNNNIVNPYVYQYDSKGNFISRLGLTVTSVLTGAKIALDENCQYVRIAFYTRLNNSDISVIMPTTIYVDAVGDDMWLPPYYDDYLSEKAEIISHFMRNEVYNQTSEKYEKVYDPDADLISFLFLTDNHYTDPAKTTQYNQMRSPAIIKRISEKVNIPIVMDGGDVDQSGLWTDLFTVPLRHAFNGDIHYAVGNHEFLSLNTGTSLYYDMDSLNNNQNGSGDHHYYYVDNAQLKLRIIVLASDRESAATIANNPELSQASQDGFTTEQKAWIRDVALATIPNDWNAIVFAHNFYNFTRTGTPSLSRGSDILPDIASNDKVIAVFQGHTHFDRIIKGYTTSLGNLPFIMTSCDKNIPHSSETVYPVNRSTGTVYEQLMDVVIINRGTKTINIVRIGGKAENGVNDNVGTEVEIRTVTYGD